ncbi:alpha/beta hydrolase [Ilumatobacter sp.]|uniref:alpha/beta hydrolase n=1 Tax=Ilumatobacter sp. TaxID=1967498 RepID=UPI003C436EAF
MSIGYLITLGVLGFFTLITLRPPRRPRVLARAAYFMGLSVNEVPHLAIGLPLTAATIDTIASGDFHLAWSSLLPIGGAAAVGAGVVAIARRGTLAWPAVTEAIRVAGLSMDDRPRRWVWRTLLTPIPWRPRHVVRVAGLRYGDHRRNRLDVYHRRHRPSGGRVLVYLHGGGYYSGGKHREGRALLHRLAAQGWVCVSANYRLRPSAGFEDHLADAHSVLAWARTHASEYGGDPERVVMAGSSAGAHLTSLLALDSDTNLDAAICLYGYYGRYYGHTPVEPVTSTPLALPAAAAPPFLIAHGEYDTWTPVEAARSLADKLRTESTKPVVAIELPGGQHGFDLWRSWRYSAVLAGIDTFLSHLDGPTNGTHSRSSTVDRGGHS